MKLLIGIPTNRDPKNQFFQSLMKLGIHLVNRGISAEIMPLTDHSCLSGGRQSLLFSAVKGDFTHLLYLDDDMGFDVDAFDYLLSRDKDFVAANYVTKKSKSSVTRGRNAEEIYSSGKKGIERITYTGLGFCLLKTEMLKTIPAPHFEVKWITELERYLTEDYFFCHLLAKHSIELYIDHDAARHVVHIGDHGYQEEALKLSI